MKVLRPMVLGVLAVGACVACEEELTFLGLVGRMMDVKRLAEPPAAGERSGCVSTTDKPFGTLCKLEGPGVAKGCYEAGAPDHLRHGSPLCGVVDARRVLVDFAVDHPGVDAQGAAAKLARHLEVTFDEPGGFVEVSAPENGWNLEDYVAVAVDLENTGPRPATILGKLNDRVTTASLVHLAPGEADTMDLLLYRKGGERRFDGMRGAPGGDLRFWDGYDPVVIRNLQLCDLDGQAVGGTVAVKNIRAVGKYLALEPAGDAFFPFVDRFGQYQHHIWPNKIFSVEQMKDLAGKEADAIRAAPRPSGWNRYGGWADGPQREATGHFRTEKVDGKWWLVDPEGRLFWSIGVNGVRFSTSTRVKGREKYFAALPESAVEKGHVDFSRENMQLKYGPEWRRTYADLCHARLSAWGMNTCGNWSDPEIYGLRRTPYVVAIHLGSKRGDEAIAIRGDEGRLRQAMRTQFSQHVASAEDPWCIGYFIDNELNWNFVPDVDRYFRVVSEELKRAAPHKLYLGSRIHNRNAAALAASAKYCDVISINCYEHSPVETPLDAPYLIGEFHFGALDRGMLATGLRSASNQRQRAHSYRHYMREAIRRPNIVGAHWFTFREQALTGRGDGENYQVGLVDVCDTPYAEMVAAIREIAVQMYRWHNGKAGDRGQ